MGNEALRADVDLSHVDYPAVQQSPEFQELRRTHRSFVFPVLTACLVWYFAYVLLAVYAVDFMSTRVFGSVNVAMLLGLAQVVTTFAVTMWYVHYANKQLDPRSEKIRTEIESGDFETEGAVR
ncbi:hypothetical protein GCM10017608_34990 [Agromyces luteolus]|uniref:DUF485 domain-containing protein n=1 Tax=Agromyces luteolus TaxID=88373 RepID=A0A7C9HI33_9MICO|nr:DUF485 domain-containing protein [Agromyces luteolus]MUN07548.1 DUF485 domain-containing protein [Agromyces luteolus]GLK29561.1 hypothetical protein GCM10017608_34990 [Agromyces luteolus]